LASSVTVEPLRSSTTVRVVMRQVKVWSPGKKLSVGSRKNPRNPLDG
jgi:hypothetical protein